MRNPVRAGDDVDAKPGGDDDVGEFLFAFQHLVDAELGDDAHQNVDVRETEISVEEQHFLSESSESDRQVYGQCRFTDAAFARRNRDHPSATGFGFGRFFQFGAFQNSGPGANNGRGFVSFTGQLS